MSNLDKAILVICDGLGDLPVPALGDKTPLEAAKTPNLDALAAAGECGMMHTLGRGTVPGSDVAHLAIFGYDLDTYYTGRGPIEVAGIGLQLKHGDVALRGNMGTVDDDWNILDRRAGRIRDTSPFTSAVDGMEIDGVTFIVKDGTGHRAGIIMRGENLSDRISDADPHAPDVPVAEVKPTDDSAEAKRTADILNKFLKQSHEILRDHPENEKRKQAGKLVANFLLVRGAGKYHAVPHFKKRYDMEACCIAGAGLYKGVGAFLGMEIMEVEGATGLPDTNVEGKFTTALECLKEKDFAFVHVKAADSLGEDGNAEGKRDFIERIDAAAAVLRERPDNILLCLTADHTTPSCQKHHSGDAVPVLFHGATLRVDGVRTFGERSCTQGGQGFMTGFHIVPTIQGMMGRLELTGA